MTDTPVTQGSFHSSRLTKACYGTTSCTGASNYFAYGYDKNSNLTTP